MNTFVWTKMQAESGVSLPTIIDHKEAERQASDKGEFWWGVGNSLGKDIEKAAKDVNGKLRVIFSTMRTQAREHDRFPSEIFLWRKWMDRAGEVHDLPPHVLQIRITKINTMLWYVDPPHHWRYGRSISTRHTA